MGSVYLPRNCKVWWIQYYNHGKRVRESSRSTRKTVATKLLALREGEVNQGKLPSYLFDKVTFDELAEDILNDYRVNHKKSLARVEQVIRLHLRPFFGHRPIREITSAWVKTYVKKRLEAGAKNGTVNRELAYLKRMLNLGAQQTPPKVDRVPKIHMLKEHNTRTGFFEHEDFVRFSSHLPEHLKGFVTFAYRTGWRRGEISGLTWSRIDRKNHVVRLEAGETKNGQARTVYLDEELQAIIAKQFAERRLGCEYVFHREGHPIREFRKSWATACKKAKVGEMLFHDLRRTAVRNMVRSGIPERVAMTISGHRTRTVFDRYNIVSEEDLKLAARRQAEYLNQ